MIWIIPNQLRYLQNQTSFIIDVKTNKTNNKNDVSELTYSSIDNIGSFVNTQLYNQSSVSFQYSIIIHLVGY